ncbi:MAG TPA: hypothetical protein QGF58_27120 [Myxococcota bacterium]|nr:hypothetical protein [Myxococcota bacterium]
MNLEPHLDEIVQIELSVLGEKADREEPIRLKSGLVVPRDDALWRALIRHRKLFVFDRFWRTEKQRAMLKAEYGLFMGREMIWIQEGPHPFVCEGWWPVLCSPGPPNVIGRTRQLVIDVKKHLPRLEFSDTEEWTRLFVATHGFDTPAMLLPYELSRTGREDGLLASFLEREEQFALPNKAYFSLLAFDGRAARGLAKDADHAIAVSAARVVLAGYQRHAHLDMGRFDAMVAAPLAASTSRSDLVQKVELARRIVLSTTHGLRTRMRLAVLAPHIRGARTSSAIERAKKKALANPAVLQGLAEVEDEVVRQCTGDFEGAFGVDLRSRPRRVVQRGHSRLRDLMAGRWRA